MLKIISILYNVQIKKLNYISLQLDFSIKKFIFFLKILILNLKIIKVISIFVM